VPNWDGPETLRVSLGELGLLPLLKSLQAGRSAKLGLSLLTTLRIFKLGAELGFGLPTALLLLKSCCLSLLTTASSNACCPNWVPNWDSACCCSSKQAGRSAKLG
jgi:hypothetical protein